MILRAIFCSLTLLLSFPATAQTYRTLRLATWNLEHLADTNGEGCRARSDADYTLLKRYAEQLKADVIALQEVENEPAVGRIFDPQEWEIEISWRHDQNPPETCKETGAPMITQRTGFAIRRGIPYTRNPDVTALDVGGTNRHRDGVDITLEAGVPIRMLSVHLKSGCADAPLDGDDADCPPLRDQSKVLNSWIEARRKDGLPFVLLGDFNRRLQNEEEVVGLLGVRSGLTLSVSREAVSRCHAWTDKFIDHIIFDQKSKAFAEFTHFAELKFAEPEAKYPSDHCPVSVDVTVPDLCDAGEPAQCADSSSFKGYLSRGLRWFRRSPEFVAIVNYLFAQASLRVKEIAEAASPSEAWAVSLDADETILDNSLGQYENEYLGLGYVKERWDQWEARGAARAMPGAVAFMNDILGKQGKIVIITNRTAGNAEATYRNLTRLGMKDDRSKVCILARSDDDKKAGHEKEWQREGYKNDKDRRRKLFETGKASACWANDGNGALESSWAKPHKIKLWVGDNVLDLPKVSADEARREGLGALKFGPDYILIPNPLYGSWVVNQP
ncbi:hypothetical protein GIW81_08420 [Hyphomicrobium sp. xq]|uniref:Endonuclease/exonuclease/phosphatase domain-containing protein n=1 Tax=Hyphomicrobium album TaxID=2665159 RepID=A0A6I3KKU3_9HYPH|nr:HAD family acid phosphatase [Hyphomicrobium album]MTD94357.1 hypothetical protein [Hyphomicrobium album]